MFSIVRLRLPNYLAEWKYYNANLTLVLHLHSHYSLAGATSDSSTTLRAATVDIVSDSKT